MMNMIDYRIENAQLKEKIKQLEAELATYKYVWAGKGEIVDKPRNNLT